MQDNLFNLSVTLLVISVKQRTTLTVLTNHTIIMPPKKGCLDEVRAAATGILSKEHAGLTSGSHFSNNYMQSALGEYRNKQ